MADNSEQSLGTMNAAELVDLFQRGDASPVEATRAALDRIERFNPTVNAYTYVDAEGALEAAHASARRWGKGEPRSAVDGVPASIKDLTEVQGMPAREGSATSSATPCKSDSPPAARLREAGAVLLGKTNTPEFGWKAVTDNPVYGTTYNPWDTRLTPGGSSGGAAAAAALNMGVLHQGGDSGGSIRIPAAFTGVFGFKPTFGWVPQWPPSKMPTLSQIGPITRTVGDAIRMLNVIGRYDFRDPYCRRGQPDDWAAEPFDDLSGLRIAYCPHFEHGQVSTGVARRIDEAAETLANLGAEVEQVENVMRDPIDIFRALWFIASQELASQMSERQLSEMDPGLRDYAERGKQYSGLDLFRAEAERSRLTVNMEHLFQSYDLMLTPSVPIEPFDASGNVPPDNTEDTDWMEWTPYSYPFNLTEQPGASVPCGFTENGLPVGMQLVSGKFDDTRILRVAQKYLEANPARFPEMAQA